MIYNILFKLVMFTLIYTFMCIAFYIKMDKKSVMSSILFVLSNSLAISSIATPSWIVTNFVGITRLGLTKICVTLKDQDPKSESCEPLELSSHWATALVFIVIGICLIFLTVLLTLLSIWRSSIEKMVRIMSFFSMCFFCMAAIIFPFGFDAKEIGGVAYKLPASTDVIPKPVSGEDCAVYTYNF
ncbi:uncharacterized protein C16orf52 homolog B-like isoform X2 [Hydractinia symbiolongicarpus]|uniref:uncharacterized protein C16orf52 homolog B-like isoform X2 n=1 Tax=Hydractinia symbiolongicarpus TaxID=13093 RepID=UPI002550D7E5|nr:uncharacterized protein C16orf52 homolog B-like isoform X2 [Hydractinia symbiolongicarpus]